MNLLHRILILWLLLFPASTLAATPNITILTPEQSAAQNVEITRAEALSFFASYFKNQAPESYSYMELKFKDIPKNSQLYKDLQVLVYFDLIKNTPSSLSPAKKINVYTFSVLAQNILWVSVTSEDSESELQSIYTKQKDIDAIQKIIENRYKSLETPDSQTEISDKMRIFQDVYTTILTEHYDRDSFDPNDIIYSAIEWLAQGTQDEYTTYFPPTESKDFEESINGEYEGIGSYVEMPEPGKLLIIAPIVDSPSEKAGIRAGDIVTQIDDKEVTRDISLKQAVSWIKWPAGTTVTLTVLRGTQTLEIEVTREKITIQDIEYKYLKNNSFYIQIRNFWPNSAQEFNKVMTELSENPQIQKVILDVRNNPGWYLGQVSRMLSHFVPDNEPTAIVDYGESEEVYRSRGYNVVDFSGYDIRLLQNRGSASASEILVGTIKDYYPEAIIIWEKSFGKGSVQNIKTYADGSTLKVTTARWFTGKTRQWIDKIGIEADIEIVPEDESFANEEDRVLETALKQ